MDSECRFHPVWQCSFADPYFSRTELEYPERAVEQSDNIRRNSTDRTIAGQYIIQVARFDPAKGIPDVLKSYVEFRNQLFRKTGTASNTPQLLM